MIWLISLIKQAAVFSGNTYIIQNDLGNPANTTGIGTARSQIQLSRYLR
ncbi:hypothetical protein ACN23B_19355 [Anabaena sp. FACHB-709]